MHYYYFIIVMWLAAVGSKFLTLSYSSKINGYLYPQRVSLPLKKRRDMFSEGNAVHPVGCDSPLQMLMAVWCIFFLIYWTSCVTACCCYLTREIVSLRQFWVNDVWTLLGQERSLMDKKGLKKEQRFKFTLTTQSLRCKPTLLNQMREAEKLICICTWHSTTRTLSVWVAWS